MKRPIEQLVWTQYGQHFSVRLRQVRTARGLSQQALADLAGLSRNQIYNLERRGAKRRIDPVLSTVYRLAQALQVPPALLLPGVFGVVGESPASASDQPQDLAPFPPEYVDTLRYG